MDLNTAAQLNKRLAELYGKDLLNRGNFRISWANNQFEKRIGEYSDWYGPIFLRSYTGMREVPKYPFNKDQWILEKLCWIPQPEVPSTASGGYYEILYAFPIETEDKPLSWNAINFVIHCILYGPKATFRNYKSLEEQMELDETANYLNLLNEDNEPTEFGFSEGMSVTIPSKIRNGEVVTL